MDVSVQMLVGSPAATGGSLAAPATAGAGPAKVMSFTQAFPSQAKGVNEAGFPGMVDRLRADFNAFRHRLYAGQDPSTHRVSSEADAAERMDRMMRDALRTQVDIFELSVSVNAGLTAAQQSQSGVKTLLEKA